ncbi:MAG: ISKra4 family transposase [bacterium]
MGSVVALRRWEAREAAEEKEEERRQMAHRLLDEMIDRQGSFDLKKGESWLARVSQGLQKERLGLLSACLQAKIEREFAPLLDQEQALCPKCRKLRQRMRFDAKVVSTLQGQFTVRRPYFYCRSCALGFHPLDQALGLSEDEHQYDVQEETIRLGADLPYLRSTEHFERLTGVAVSGHLAHEKLNEVGEHATLEEVIPSAEEMERRVTEVARDQRRWRPVLVVAVDGAHTPIRPAGGREDKRGAGSFREVKGCRVYLIGKGGRIVDLASWHQVQDAQSLERALVLIRDRLPLGSVRIALVADGAEWIWEMYGRVFPEGTPVLDYYHCAEHVWEVAEQQFAESMEALQFGEVSLALLSCGLPNSVAHLWRGMKPKDSLAAEKIERFAAYLEENQDRINYRKNRRRGVPNGSGAIESANKFLCHARLKVSGAWWLEENSNAMLRIRCAIHNGTFETVFRSYVTSKARL